MTVNQAIAILFHAIDEKTEQGVSNALRNPETPLYQRTDILRRMFADEQKAQRALSRALRAVQNYTEN